MIENRHIFLRSQKVQLNRLFLLINLHVVYIRMGIYYHQNSTEDVLFFQNNQLKEPVVDLIYYKQVKNMW